VDRQKKKVTASINLWQTATFGQRLIDKSQSTLVADYLLCVCSKHTVRISRRIAGDILFSTFSFE